jgi:hypothetical protein
VRAARAGSHPGATVGPTSSEARTSVVAVGGCARTCVAGEVLCIGVFIHRRCCPGLFWHGFTVSGTRALLVSTVLLAAHSTFPKQCLRLALQQILTGPGPPNGWPRRVQEGSSVLGSAHSTVPKQCLRLVLQQILTGPGPPNGWPRCVQEASAVFLSPWWCDAAVERVRLTAPRVGVAGLARCPSRQRQIWTRLRTRFELGVVQDLVALGVPQWAARAHTGLTAPQSNGGRWDGAAASSVPARATGAAASSGRSSQIQGQAARSCTQGAAGAWDGRRRRRRSGELVHAPARPGAAPRHPLVSSACATILAGKSGESLFTV